MSGEVVDVNEAARAGLLQALEAILFVSDEPVAAVVLAQALGVERREAEELCEALARSYEERGAGLVLRNVAGGWRLATSPDAAPVVERYVLSSRHARLTKAALETLAIVAYKQPVTRHQVSSIRGVNSDGVLRALVDRGLVAEVGARGDARAGPSCTGRRPSSSRRLGLPSLSALPSLAPLLGQPAADAEGGAGRAPPASTPARWRSSGCSARSPAPGSAPAGRARSSSRPGACEVNGRSRHARRPGGSRAATRSASTAAASSVDPGSSIPGPAQAARA